MAILLFTDKKYSLLLTVKLPTYATYRSVFLLWQWRASNINPLR